MHLITTLILALVLSFDGFGVGLAYGIKKITIPAASLLIMCCCAMLAILVSMVVGHGLSIYFNPEIAKRIGAIVLMFMGSWFISDALLNGKKVQRKFREQERNDQSPVITTLKLRPFNLVIQILREPAKADLDSSGTIGHKEALLLGTALALDGLGAGIAAALAGFKIILTMCLVGICEFIMVNLGFALGDRLQQNLFENYAGLVSGLVLCLLGLFRLV